MSTVVKVGAALPFEMGTKLSAGRNDAFAGENVAIGMNACVTCGGGKRSVTKRVFLLLCTFCLLRWARYVTPTVYYGGQVT